MAEDFFDNNGGAGDNKYATAANWNNGTVPGAGDNAFFTDARASTSIDGETVAEAALPDAIVFTKYAGNVGTSGSHLIFTAAAGDDDLAELRIENSPGKYYIDVNHAGGDDEVTDTHINVPGMASDQINLGGTAPFVNMHLTRGRTNLGQSGTITDLWVAHSTTPRDVHADIASGATVTNVRQGGGLVTSVSSNATALWMQNAGSARYTGSGTITDYYIFGGNFRFDGNTAGTTITNVYVYGGNVDLTRAGNLRTIGSLFVWPGGTVDIRHVEKLITFTNTPIKYGSGRIMGNTATTSYA